MVNGYSHRDSIQLQQFEEDFREALFARHFNIAIGFLQDVMTGTCLLGKFEFAKKGNYRTTAVCLYEYMI